MTGPNTRPLAPRVAAAVLGGYPLANLLAIAASALLHRLGMDQAHAVLAATLAGVLAYALIVMAIFHAHSTARLWVWLATAGSASGLCVMMLSPGADVRVNQH